ncbi:hypothetical protein MKW92_044990 [Papaver armeniacum]|nr:hypothetical protein MKW92_044989 [Papaver armeniacum]KAI3906748.1 hypothetical protein MKW92_044990 [Papaver armeniacum]
MVDALPKHVIIQSFHSHSYLQFDKENSTVPNALQFTQEYSFDLNTRFEVVQSATHTGLIHIRSLHNSKYWANHGTDKKWVTAMANKPEENMDDQNCTLFRPEFVSSDDNHRHLYLRHCSTGNYIRTRGASVRGKGLMCLMSRNEAALFTFIDWKSIVVLPNIIRIKGDNGNYLKAFEGGFMDYRYQADNSSLFDYEVYPSRDGGIRLKSVAYGTYWTDTGVIGLWVVLDGYG